LKDEHDEQLVGLNKLPSMIAKMVIRRNHEYAKEYCYDRNAGNAGFGMPAAFGMFYFYWMTAFFFSR